MMRKRYKKRIELSKVDEVWKDWVEIMIVEPLLKGHKVNIDKHCTLEIVGSRVIDNKKVFNLLSNGIMVQGRMVKKAIKLNQTRKGLTYRIEMIDNNFKEGKLLFTAAPYIKKRVNESLKNTNTYYRIEQ